MDSFQIILYVVIGIIYLLSRVLKNAKTDLPAGTGTPPAPKPAANPSPRPEPSTLEEMFKEIKRATQEAKQTASQKKTEQTQQNAPQRQRIDQPKKKQKNSTKQSQSTEWVPTYERLEQNARSYEQEPSADELAPRFERVPFYANEATNVDYEDPARANYAGLDDRKQRLTSLEKRQVDNKKNIYGKLLQNPQTARQAFIMGEIFKRKYE